MKIRTMQPGDLEFAAECTENEGWDIETSQELQLLYSHGPNGSFIADWRGIRAGMCIATSYGDFGFLGELIVVKELRNKGIGSSLLAKAIDYLQAQGCKTIFLDAVLPAVSLYQRAGFQKVCRSWRFSGSIHGQLNQNVCAMTFENLDAIVELDTLAFGADRRYFLSKRLELCPSLCKVLQVNGEIHGFIMGRRGRNDISVGPWIASFQAQTPTTLLEALATEVPQFTLRIGVLQHNQVAINSIKSYGLKENPLSPWRMALGNDPPLREFGNEYAIGSPAKG